MLSSALALPLNRRHSTLSTASSQDDNSIISAEMMATTENDNANDFGDFLATNNGVNNAAEVEGGTQLEEGVDIAIDNKTQKYLTPLMISKNSEKRIFRIII